MCSPAGSAGRQRVAAAAGRSDVNAGWGTPSTTALKMNRRSFPSRAVSDVPREARDEAGARPGEARPRRVAVSSTRPIQRTPAAMTPAPQTAAHQRYFLFCRSTRSRRACARSVGRPAPGRGAGRRARSRAPSPRSARRTPARAPARRRPARRLPQVNGPWFDTSTAEISSGQQVARAEGLHDHQPGLRVRTRPRSRRGSAAGSPARRRGSDRRGWSPCSGSAAAPARTRSRTAEWVWTTPPQSNAR